MGKILVISDRFPSINQPWLDTYLIQLLKNKLSFNIYSYNKELGTYNKKVDEHKLREHQINFSLSRSKQIINLAKHLISSPIKTLKTLIQINEHSKELSCSIIETIISTIKIYHLQTLSHDWEDYSACHSHTEIGAFDFLHFTIQKKIPLLLTFHGLPPKGVNQLSKQKRQILYKNVTAVFVNTVYSQKQIQHFGCPAEKIIILPQGLPLEDFPFFNERPPAKEKLKLLTVGRFQKDKGQDYALLALARLRRYGINAQWHFVGVGTEGLYLLKKHAEKLGVSKNAIFHENIDNTQLKQIYHDSHLFILSSLDNEIHAETQGIVIQEAQACGCIVIATAVGGIPECVIDGENAFLIQPASSKSVFNTIKKLYLAQENWYDIRSEARKYVEKHFSADEIGKSMATHLKRLIYS